MTPTLERAADTDAIRDLMREMFAETEPRADVSAAPVLNGFFSMRAGLQVVTRPRILERLYLAGDPEHAYFMRMLSPEALWLRRCPENFKLALEARDQHVAQCAECDVPRCRGLQWTAGGVRVWLDERQAANLVDWLKGREEQ